MVGYFGHDIESTNGGKIRAEATGRGVKVFVGTGKEKPVIVPNDLLRVFAHILERITYADEHTKARWDARRVDLDKKRKDEK